MSGTTGLEPAASAVTALRELFLQQLPLACWSSIGVCKCRIITAHFVSGRSAARSRARFERLPTQQPLRLFCVFINLGNLLFARD
jgi:hypothetical protein